jgi:IclR family pca regulon transcriptional regulator
MIQSLERAFSILRLLDGHDPAEEGLGAQEVANRTGLKFPTAHNFLKSLVELGSVERVPGNGRYRVSARLGRLGNRRNRLRMLESVASAEIQLLADRFHETVSLSLEIDFRRRGLILAESTQELRVVQSHGEETFYPFPVGRVQLSRMTPERLDEFVARRGLPTGEWPGVETREQLDAALERIRREGCEVKRNEAVGAAAIAVPVLGLGDEWNAALCLVLPLLRFDAARCREIVAALQESARNIATAMLDA